MSARIGWIARRARKLMRTFNIKRSKAVRYAYEDWKDFKGGRLSCDELGVCQDREDCACPRPSRAMADFRRFMSRTTGEAL